MGEDHVTEEKRRFVYGHVVGRTGVERSFGDYVSRESIFSVYVGERGGDSFTTRFREEMMENSPFATW
jgi:hypothetical protein